jgi:hypothetical protein
MSAKMPTPSIPSISDMFARAWMDKKSDLTRSLYPGLVWFPARHHTSPAGKEGTCSSEACVLAQPGHWAGSSPRTGSDGGLLARTPELVTLARSSPRSNSVRRAYLDG